jgi:hypothetical protein
VGNYLLHKTSSENGMMLGQFAMRNNLVIKSTCFPHKKIHLTTWKSPDAGTLNQIVHALIAARHSSSIMDVRSCRGPNCYSNHYLVKTIVREKLTKTQGIHSMRRRRWHLDRLKDEDLKQRYQREIQSKLDREEERENIEEEWKRIEEVVKKTAEETIGEKRVLRNEWFDQEFRKAIEEQNKAREKMIQKETRGHCEKYKQLRL